MVWLAQDSRRLARVEALLLQDVDPKYFRALHKGVWSGRILQDLVGSAFNTGQLLAWTLSVVESIYFCPLFAMLCHAMAHHPMA